MKRGGLLAVAVHDVEPATFERCLQMRSWLEDHGVTTATLLVIPARDMHPLPDRSPDLAHWLALRVRAGDAVAQHGFQHRQTRPAGALRQALAHWQGGPAAEFPGLDVIETRSAVHAGRRVVEQAGLAPRGFVAPAYAYTPALREALHEGFDWWATLRAVHRRDGRRRAAALCLGSSGPVKRATSPLLVRARSHACGRLMRLDLHPADFERITHVRALEAALAAAHGRTSVTYDELLCA